MPMAFAPFRAGGYLSNDETIADHLSAADDDPAPDQGDACYAATAPASLCGRSPDRILSATARFEDENVIKPGPGDKKVPVLISGQELLELQRFTWMMAEAFGLDRRIENYQGKRPIGLYSWDFEVLLAVLDSAVKHKEEYPNKNAPGWKEINDLFRRLSAEYQSHFGRIA